MNKRRPRILWLGEATFLSTGYSVYGKEVLSRLYAMDKYDIAELASYGTVNDERRLDIPWTYYANMPVNDAEYASYKKEVQNAFGMWRLEPTCLDWKPDIVIDIRDPWMSDFIALSTYRKFFHWALMPTVDSAPQADKWLDMYVGADSVCAYAEYGRDVLMRETNGAVKFKGVASPSADYNIFKPTKDKKQHKNSFGLDPNSIIVGTVMRNQKRKLYPDLINSFKEVLAKCPSVADRLYLYLHTAYPDIGWNIPALIKESGIGHKILFTYVCSKCDHVFPSFFHDASQYCPKCKEFSARMPSTAAGISTQALNVVYNCFDVYVQYSVCEGFGMPQLEAAACGVPLMATYYSAMESIVDNLGAIPIKPIRHFKEIESGLIRVYPDNNDFITKLCRLVQKSPEELQKIGTDIYLKCRSVYNYDRAAAVWADIVDNLELKPHELTWNSPPQIIKPNVTLPPNLTNAQFVRWCILNVICDPSLINTFIEMRMIRDLTHGTSGIGGTSLWYDDSYASTLRSTTKCSPKEIINECVKVRENRNQWESMRANYAGAPKAAFIQMAKRDNRA